MVTSSRASGARPAGRRSARRTTSRPTRAASRQSPGDSAARLRTIPPATKKASAVPASRPGSTTTAERRAARHAGQGAEDAEQGLDRAVLAGRVDLQAALRHRLRDPEAEPADGGRSPAEGSTSARAASRAAGSWAPRVERVQAATASRARRSERIGPK